MVETHRGKCHEAKALYQRILSIQQEKAGPVTPVVMPTLNNLGRSYLRLSVRRTPSAWAGDALAWSAGP
jgi:hypothetical protein